MYMYMYNIILCYVQQCDLLSVVCVYVYIIRGEPERAPNTRVIYGEFAVPMYVCIYVQCMYVCM